MTRRLILIFLICVLCIHATAQDKYFQQEVRHRISVSLDDVKHTLTGLAEITYINHSPDTLKELWFHLYPNAYQNRETALSKNLLQQRSAALYFADSARTGSIKDLDFHSEGKKLEWAYDSEHNDICRVQLHRNLLPGDSISLRTPFHLKIPDARISRLGHIGQAYAITQWYPKPAVYDRDGWHAMPYLDQGEFYSEFGSYHVEITLPSNYIVAATGDLQNNEKEMEWLEELSKREIIIGEKRNLAFPPSSSETKTLIFHQENVHDFAWFADKRFNVRKKDVILSGDTVTAWAYFTEMESELWMNATEYIARSLEDFSKWIGKYPYRHCTAIDGTISAGAGMEYPNITIIGSAGDAVTLETVIAHEVAHNWFQGMIATNERIYPWIDEGFASYYETRYLQEKYGAKTQNHYHELVVNGFMGKILKGDRLNEWQAAKTISQFPVMLNRDQSLALPAENYNYLNYGFVIYKKSIAAIYYLENYLGRELFDHCIQTFFDEWKYKHPAPEDLQHSFEQSSGKDLSWFFKELISGTDKQDLRISGVKKRDDRVTLNVHARHSVNYPVPVASMQGDSIEELKWVSFSGRDTTFTLSCKSCDRVVIDPGDVSLDVNTQNNTMRTGGIFRKTAPIIFQPFAAFRDEPSHQLFYSPAIGWNNYNGVMAGVVLHNKFLPPRKFEFALTPLYGFTDKEIAGMVNMDYHFLPESRLFRDIVLSAAARRFAFSDFSYRGIDGKRYSEMLHYIRFSPSLRFELFNSDYTSFIHQQFTISSVHLWQEDIHYNRTHPAGFSYGTPATESKNFYRLQYQFADNRLIDPWGIQIKLEGANDLFKTDVTLKYHFSYKRPSRGVDIRMFAGKVWAEALGGMYNYTLSDRSTAGGTTDYAFDDYYFGRTETEDLLSRQMALREGAFKVINPLGSFREWITSLSAEADFPGRLPLRFYAEAGIYNDLKNTMKQVYDINQSVTYDAGICITAGKEAVAIYLPLFRSAEIKEYEKTNGLTLRDQIRFVINITKLNPLNIRKQLFP